VSISDYAKDPKM